MGRTRRLAVGALLTCILLAAVPASSRAGSPGHGGLVGSAAPGFAVKDISGAPVELAAVVRNSRATVLNFWGLRCQACLEEMPYLNALYAKYKAAGVSVLGVNVDGVGPDIIKAQLPRLPTAPDYPILPDEELKVADLYKLAAAPMTVVVDASGVIVFSHEGFEAGDEKKLEERIAGLLR